MELIYKLLNTPCASGLEAHFAELLKNELGGGCTDENGSLIYHKEGKGKSIIFAASMDSPSVFVTHTGENGFVRFCTNGIEAKDICGMHVRFDDNSRGVVFKEKDRENTADFFIDTFGRGAKESESASPDIPVTETDNTVSAFDAGRAAVIYAMLKAAKALDGADVYFVFLAKTLGNRHSASFLERLPRDAELVFIDKSEANDIPGEREVFVRLGGGVCVRAMDKSVISSKPLFEKAAALKNVKIQKEVSQRKNAGGALQKAFTGLGTLSVGLPVRYCGRLCETVSKEDISELAKFIECYSNEGQEL